MPANDDLSRHVHRRVGDHERRWHGSRATLASRVWATPLAFSGWVVTELASALAMKQRRRLLDESGRKAAEHQWRDLSASWRRLSITERHFADAARLTSLGLRAGDALHLAVAAGYRTELVTGDDGLASVAEQVGLTVHRPSREATGEA